jgi:hypothetical protein
MGTFKIQYTGTEAVEMIKSYYPNNWRQLLDNKKSALIKLSNIHKISVEKAYRKFIIPVARNEESIVFFAALSELLKFEKMKPREKSDKIIELENKRENVARQIVALESDTNTFSYEDKKILRGHYTQLQQTTTSEINELLKSFEVIEPQLIIHQPGLFDTRFND